MDTTKEPKDIFKFFDSEQYEGTVELKEIPFFSLCEHHLLPFWGTIVKLMKQTILTDTKLYPFFWYSHNPNILGYLNSLREEAGLPEKMLETINDSLECMFPQPYQRPVQITDNGNGPEVVLAPSAELAVAWGKAALDGVSSAARQFDGNITHDMEITHLRMLAELSTTTLKTKEWTGVLPHNTPTWSHGDEFLAEWPENLLP